MKPLKVKLLSPEAILPKKQHPTDAAFDVCVPRDVMVNPGRNMIPLDIAIELDPFLEAKIEPRSGMSVKGMDGYNFLEYETSRWGRDADVIVGKIDSGYRGNVGVIMISREDRPFWIKRGTRVAQMTIYRLPRFTECISVEELSEADRGINGFGSTGTQSDEN